MENTPKPRAQRKRRNVASNLTERLASLLLTEAVASGSQTQPPPGQGRRGRRRRRRRGRLGATPGPPVSFPSSGLRNDSARPITVSGVDWIESTQVTEKSPDGDPILDFQIAPWDWPGTHAALLSRGYEKYRLRSFHIELSSRSPSFLGGGYVAGISPDPRFRVVSVDPFTTRRQVRSLAGSVSSNWWQTSKVTLPAVLFGPDWKYTSQKEEDIRWCSFGRFVAVVDGPPSGMTANSSIRVVAEVKWTIEFSGPITDSSSVDRRARWTMASGDVWSPPLSSEDYGALWLKGSAETMWDNVAYSAVLYLVNGVSGSLFRKSPGKEDPVTSKVYWFRTSKLSSGSKALIAYESDIKAREAPENPSRDPSAGQYQPFPGVAFPSVEFLVLT